MTSMHFQFKVNFKSRINAAILFFFFNLKKNINKYRNIDFIYVGQCHAYEAVDNMKYKLSKNKDGHIYLNRIQTPKGLIC